MSPTQRRILDHLAMRGHAMFGHELAAELGIKHIAVTTTRRLCKFQCIVSTNQGWILTDIGEDARKTGVMP